MGIVYSTQRVAGEAGNLLRLNLFGSLVIQEFL